MPILKKLLFDTYGGFADKRIKDLSKGNIFIVDDRTRDDEGARGLYSSFCMIFADVRSNNEVAVRLQGNVPIGGQVQEWLDEHDLEIEDSELHKSLVLVITPGGQNMLDELARAIERITAPGRRYTVKSYKYVCPRTAGALKRLKRTLDKAWKNGRIQEGFGLGD